jgi:hypothetical protein
VLISELLTTDSIAASRSSNPLGHFIPRLEAPVAARPECSRTPNGGAPVTSVHSRLSIETARRDRPRYEIPHGFTDTKIASQVPTLTPRPDGCGRCHRNLARDVRVHGGRESRLEKPEDRRPGRDCKQDAGGGHLPVLRNPGGGYRMGLTKPAKRGGNVTRVFLYAPALAIIVLVALLGVLDVLWR